MWYAGNAHNWSTEDFIKRRRVRELEKIAYNETQRNFQREQNQIMQISGLFPFMLFFP